MFPPSIDWVNIMLRVLQLLLFVWNPKNAPHYRLHSTNFEHRSAVLRRILSEHSPAGHLYAVQAVLLYTLMAGCTSLFIMDVSCWVENPRTWRKRPSDKLCTKALCFQVHEGLLSYYPRQNERPRSTEELYFWISSPWGSYRRSIDRIEYRSMWI